MIKYKYTDFVELYSINNNNNNNTEFKDVNINGMNDFTVEPTENYSDHLIPIYDPTHIPIYISNNPTFNPTFNQTFTLTFNPTFNNNSQINHYYFNESNSKTKILIISLTIGIFF